MLTLKNLRFVDGSDTLLVTLSTGPNEVVVDVPGRVLGPAFRQFETCIREVVEALLKATNEHAAAQAAKDAVLGPLLASDAPMTETEPKKASRRPKAEQP